MASPSIYTLELMTVNPQYRAKVIRGIAIILRNEKAHIQKYKLLSKVLGVLGWLITVLAFFAAFRMEDSTAVWIVCLAALGAGLGSLSFHFKDAVQQWPVIREFINDTAIQEADNDAKP